MASHLKVVLAALAVLGVVAVAALVGTRLTGDDRVVGTALPAPPDGRRWVGMDDVVVAVPDWWTTGEARCGAPAEDTVYFDAAATYECLEPVEPATVREVSALAVFDGTCCYGEHQLRSMTPVSEVDGHELVERGGCEEWFRGVCRQLFGVPDLGVMFAVTIAEPGDGDYEAIRDSMRVLPNGFTTVPLKVGSGFTPGRGTEPSLVDDVVAAAEKAGLVADVETLESAEGGDVPDLPPGSLLGVSPSPGSVIEDGGTVTITVLGGR